jgi:predicted branched-subunit amino acid permease
MLTVASDHRDHDVFRGARAMAPWLVGVVPFGLVIGITAAHADIPAAAGWLTGPLIFAGSAQVATIQLLAGGGAAITVVVAALAINLRLVLYSATMAPHWRSLPRRSQALAAYTLVDPTLAVAVREYESSPDPAVGHRHYLGAAATLWAAWVAAITAGMTLGSALPDALHLELVIPLFLAGEVVPRVTNTTSARAVAVAVALAMVGRWIPLHLGTFVAIVGGIAIAVVTDARTDKDAHKEAS